MKKILLTIILTYTFCLSSFSQVYYGMLDENKTVTGELPLQNDNTRINGIESDLGKKLGMAMIFMWYPQTIDVAGCNSLISRGITPVITLEAGMSFTSITSGTYDAYFKSIADGLKQINGTVILRYNHEMNGNWYSWSGALQGNNATAATNYISAWKYVYNLVKIQNGATNALWNWCVNVRSYSSTGSTTDSWNEPMDYYPGDAYVDWIGFDSYDKPYSTSQGYQTVDNLFSTIYKTITTAVPDKPVFIGEFASENMDHETDPHKLDFFSQGANLFTNYPRIHAFAYFNSIKYNSGRWNNYKYNNPATCTAVFKSNWISNVNVVSGNSGISNLHKYSLLSQTGTLKIEAENYFDQFGVKSETCTEGGLDVGSATTGDYMDYLVEVSTSGTYACSFRLASSLTTGKIDIKNSAGTTLASYAQTTSTGGSQAWKTVTINVALTAGKQKIRLYHSGSGLNINWFQFAPADPFTTSYFHLVNKSSADYMRPTAGSATATITQEQVTSTPTLSSFQWEFITVPGTTYYYIVNKSTGKAIQPTGGSTLDNVGLSQTTLSATNQNYTELHWSIVYSGESPYYWIKNRKSGLYIRPNAGANGTGIAIVQNTLSTSTNSFKWSFVNQGSKPVTNAAFRIGAEFLESNMIADEIQGTIIYPNPTDGIVRIATNIEQESAVSISIYNMVGELTLSKDYGNRVGKFDESLDISKFSSGTYILKMLKGEIIETKKITKF